MKTENNILIAEFMNTINNGNNNIIYDVTGKTKHKFNQSWDWLIPVVAKCYEYGNLGDDSRLEIEESLIGIIDINTTYEAVVEFIKHHNRCT